MITLTRPWRFLALLVWAIGVAASPSTSAQTLVPLHDFNGPDGGDMRSGVALNSAGIVYGTTFYGGDLSCAQGGGYGCGTIYKFDPATQAVTTLYAFSGGADGGFPAAGVVIDKKGNLIGTSQGGGSVGVGTLFKFSPATLKLTTLHNFGSVASDGAYPRAEVVINKKGVIYGTTQQGGSSLLCTIGCGTAFKFDPATSLYSVLHVFNGDVDGFYPSRLVFGKAGALYGTSQGSSLDSGCPNGGCGRVFKLDPATGKVSTLFVFTTAIDPVDGHDYWPDGATPKAGLVADAAGSLYGTTYFGGTDAVPQSGAGTAFKLSPPATGKKQWTFTLLHDFCPNPNSACYAHQPSGLAMDAAGQLYGLVSTSQVDASLSVFQLDPVSGATTLLIAGIGSTLWPAESLALDGSGALYGTTEYGGADPLGACPYASGCGNLFKVIH